MSWWPGWDSIESTTRWQDIYFWFGVVCLVMLAVSAVVSHRYGVRKDELVAIAERDAITQRQREKDEADDRIRQLQNALSEADKELSEFQKEQGRRITGQQKAELIAALSAFRGQKISVVCVKGDEEGLALAQDLVAIFVAANWDFEGALGVAQATYPKNPIGVEVTLNESEVKANRVPRAGAVLINSLIAMRLTDGGYKNAGVPPNKIEVRVGNKPTP